MSRPEPRPTAAFAAVITLTAVCALVAPLGSTFAAYSDTAAVRGNNLGAGVWAPDPPAACGGLEDYTAVVYGTVGDDVLEGGNGPQVIMGLAGNDILHGSNNGDCLVGGPGDDKLYGGNAKDILIGGDGDDLLDGGNGKDFLDAGGSLGDICEGGNGNDTIFACDPVAPLVGHTSATSSPAELVPLDTEHLSASISTSSDSQSPIKLPTTTTTEVVGDPPSPSPTPDSGASVEVPPEAPLTGQMMVEEEE